MKRPLGIYGPSPAYHPYMNGEINLKLPLEIFEVIFSNLRDLDIQSVQTVCHFWNERTICIAKNNILEMKRFVNFLTYTFKKASTTKKYIAHQNEFNCLFSGLIANIDRKLYETPAHQKRLANLDKSLESLDNLSNFQDFVSLRCKFKNEFFEFLRFIEPSTLAALKDLSVNEVKIGFFEHVFNLVKFQNKMHILDKTTDKKLKSIMIKDLVMNLAHELVEEREIDKEVRNTYPSKMLGLSKSSIFRSIKWIIGKENVKEGLYGRNALFSYIAKQLAPTGDVFSSLHFCTQIKSYEEYDSTLESILMDLLKKGLHGEAFCAARKIQDAEKRNSALKRIWPPYNELVHEGLESTCNTLFAMVGKSGFTLDRPVMELWFFQFILAQPNTPIEELLKLVSINFKLKICDIILNHIHHINNLNMIVELARELASRTHDYPNAYIGLAYDKITKPGISNYGIAIAIERLIEKYSVGRDKNHIFYLVASELATSGDLDTALQFCKRIDSSEKYDSALESISTELALGGYSNNAMYFAEKIYDDAKRNSAYSVIFPSDQVY